MASTYTTLGIEKQATGENAGTWGTKTNKNLEILQQITGGFSQVSIAGGAQTTALTVVDGNTSYKIILGNTVSNNALYNGLKSGTLELNNSDSESPGVTLRSRSLTTSETVQMQLSPSNLIIKPLRM